MEPHWDDVKVFLAVAREESLSGAGRKLKLDPATVGRRITRLETAVEAPLFLKSPQGYTLTPAGERLLAHGERVEQAMRSGMDAITGSTDRLTGQIRIGAPDGCATYLLPQVCLSIAEENPDLDIQIVAQPRVVNLSRREADMAVTVSQPTAGQLLVQKIADYRLHLAASERYLADNRITRLDDLRGRPMVGYIPDMIFDAELDYLHELGADRVALASNSVPVQLRMTEGGHGLCVAHDFALPSHPTLRKVLTEDISLTRAFFLVRHQSDQKSERHNRFSHLLVERLRAEVARLEAAA
ncbi:MAG: LysR family transcriptional regulator [Rhodobacteraceae bacterium]|nr:LysR family transcriptional regulator [Paracoccaceae bacterium]